MQTIRIILSASKSLQQERMELADLVENLNHSLEGRDANILMLMWDGSESSIDSFKEKITDTDLCLNVYYDTFDICTQSELDTAYKSLCEGRNPKKIYVYFKENDTISDQLKAFRDSFPTKYGHFYCSFANIDTLKADFLLQFMEYQSKNIGNNKMLEVSNGKVTLDGKECVELKNVPFAGNNEEYNLLLKSIKKTQKLLAITEEDDPDYADYAADLQEMKTKLSKMESSLWNTALMITRLSTTTCSERLKRAMDLFTAGDNKGAQAILNEEEIEKDIEHNLYLIQLGEEGKKGLATNIEEYRLKIKTLENDINIDYNYQIIDLYKKALSAAKGHIDVSDYTELLWDYVDYLHHQNLYALGEDLFDECLELTRSNTTNNSEDSLYKLALCLNDIADFHRDAGEFKRAGKEYFESIELRRRLVESRRDDYLPGLARCLEGLAILKSDGNDHAMAISMIEEAIKYRKEFHELNKGTNSSEKYAHCLGSYAYILGNVDRNNDAVYILKECIEIFKGLSWQNESDLQLKYNIATYLDNLAILYKDMEEYNDAESMSLEALGISRDLYERRKNAYGPIYANNLFNLGSIFFAAKIYDKGITYMSDALLIFTEMEEMNPGVYKGDMALCFMNRAYLYTCTGYSQEAYSDFTQAIKLFRTLVIEDEDYYTKYLADCLSKQSMLLVEMCQNDSAIKILTESVGIYRKLNSKYPDVYIPELADALSNLGYSYILSNKGFDAEHAIQEAIELIGNINDQGAYLLKLASYYLYLGRTYCYCLNKNNEAIKAIEKSVQYYKSLNDKDGVNASHELGMAYDELANAYHKHNDSKMAELMFQEGITVLESIPNASPREKSSLANILNNFAWFYYENGKFVMAEPLSLKAIKIEEEYCNALGNESRNMAEFRDTLEKIKEKITN